MSKVIIEIMKALTLNIFPFFFILFIYIDTGCQAQNSVSSPIHVELVRDNFATITNENHQNNRIGVRFFEHNPIVYGKVPLSEETANIKEDDINAAMDKFTSSKNLFIYKRVIGKHEGWSRQEWIFHMLPVEDGIEILLVVKTYEEGLPEYYGVQQCFRMSGATNIGWRKEVALTPAFSEYDHWRNQDAPGNRESLTYVVRDGSWEAIPATENTLGARTPTGIAVDFLRSDGNLPEKVGPYEAEMLKPVDLGLVTRSDKNSKWVCGLYWENTTHVTDHHPADCIHSIINIGNIPPFSTRVIRGKIYWFEGTKPELQKHFYKDFFQSASQKLTIASCQFPVSGNILENSVQIQDQMRMAKLRGAEVVHFPECALSGYGGADFQDYNTFEWSTLKSQTDIICALAKDLNLWVLLGSTHQLSEGNKPHNSLYVINPEGKVIDRYDKRFCTSGDLDYYTPGNHFVNFKIKDINCGLLICYDVRFPELYREYRKRDTDILFQSFYNARHKENCIHPKIMPVTAQVRAATNSFFMSLTNSSAPYSWPCHFITPDGLISKKLPANESGIMISTVEISKKYYDASSDFRMEAMDGKLNSGDIVEDPKSENRTDY